MQPLNRVEMNHLGDMASLGDEKAALRLGKELVCLGVHLAKYYSDKYGVDFEPLMEAVETEWFAQLANRFSSYLQSLDDILTYLHDMEEKFYQRVDAPDGVIKVLISHYHEVCKCRKMLQVVSSYEPLVEKIAGMTRIPQDEVELIVNNEQKRKKRSNARRRSCMG